MQIEELWQFPVKGLGGHKIAAATLAAGRHFPDDRRFAISTGDAKSAATASGTWLQKAHFLQLLTHEDLAAFQCSYSMVDGVATLTLSHRDRTCLAINPADPDQRAALEQLFADRLGARLAGWPRLFEMPTGAYSDQPTALISLASTASLAAFAAASGTRPDNRRFRINIVISGVAAFQESELIGRHMQCGDAKLAIKKPVGRCAAINVDPDTARRGPDHLAMMRTHFGHSDLGIFAEITGGGQIKAGDKITLL